MKNLFDTLTFFFCAMCCAIWHGSPLDEAESAEMDARR